MARILAVDDERAILDALARVLGRDGHEVVRAADPTAVPGMDLSRFDLVLCDVMMPELDGFELSHRISPPGRELPEFLVEHRAARSNPFVRGGDRRAGSVREHLPEPGLMR